MSRSYEVTINITDHDQPKYEAILDALEELEVDTEAGGTRQTGTPNESIEFPPETINLCAGHSDEDYARDIREAVWKANGAFCQVIIWMRPYDEEIPSYTGDKAEYDAFVAGQDE